MYSTYFLLISSSIVYVRYGFFSSSSKFSCQREYGRKEKKGSKAATTQETQTALTVTQLSK
jgi:hypothetical protein